MEKEQRLPAGITPELLTTLKEKYGNRLRYADLPKDDNGDEYLTVIVCVPDRVVTSEFEKWIESNPLKAKELLVNACLLTHKEEVKADDGLFYATVNAISSLIPLRKAVVRNI